MKLNRDNLIFLHIPKAAGSTLHPVLQRHYKRDATRTISLPQELEAFKQLPEVERSEIRLLKGHMPFGMHHYLSGRTRYVTLLRHPVERIISHFYYVKRSPDHYLYSHIAKGMRLAEFVSAGISGEIDNGQVRLLSGHDQDIPFGECTRELLDIAKRNIEADFAAVGLTERFDESLALMGHALGWQWTPYYLNLNVTRDKPAANRIAPSALKIIEEANALDLELYQWASDRFCEQLKASGPAVAERLGRLERSNRLYRPVGTLVYSLKRRLRRMVTSPPMVKA